MLWKHYDPASVARVGTIFLVVGIDFAAGERYKSVSESALIVRRPVAHQHGPAHNPTCAVPVGDAGAQTLRVPARRNPQLPFRSPLAVLPALERGHRP
jgi:hypothetical protein